MKVARPVVFWVAIATITIVALIVLRQVLLPFVVGIVVAYLLTPAIDRLERIGINRSFAALTVVLSLVLAFVAIVLVMLPVFIGELRFFLEAFPRYVARLQSLATDANVPWLRNILGSDIHIEQSAANMVTTRGGEWVDDILRSAWSSGRALISFVSLLVVAPVIAIYLLIDWKRMIATVTAWFPQLRRDDIRALGHEIRDTVGGFARGQVVICLILAVLYAAALKLTGLNHAILIGITAGLISFVPYLGAATGLVISLCVAIAQFWPNWTPIVVVGLIFLVGETIADYVLSPRIIGSRVKLHPVWLMFALFAFGWLFGFVGLLIAVPLAASLGVLLRFAMQQFQVASPRSHLED
jgi:predicted PurR-regulated permease PerM